MTNERKICPNCGNICNNDDIFCNKCGTKLNLDKEHTCPNCGTQYKPDVDLFCKNCGQTLKTLELKCPNCGTKYESGDLFCGECGTELCNANNKNKVSGNYNTAHKSTKIIKCPYCGKKLNGDVMKCPHCGEWLKRKKPFGCYGILSTTIFLSVLVIAWIITGNLSIALAWGLGIVLGLWLYFIPAWVAETRNHPNAGAIFAVNLLLGSTGVGWIISLIWALCGGGENKY